MKKSTIIFIALIITLYSIPAILYGIARMLPEEVFFTGFSDQYQIIRINNPDLRPEDVVMDARPASGFPRTNLLFPKDKSYLYYEGKQRYLSEINNQDSLLIIGRPKDAEGDQSLKLHIRINNVQEVVLNGKTVWTR